MSNSMSFSNADLSKLVESASKKVSAKSSGTKNAQYYKERLEKHVLDLSTSTNTVVRLAVAKSDNASASCLKSMLEVETDQEIIGVILTHPNLAKSVKHTYVKKNEELVKSIIEMSDTNAPTEDEVSEALNS